MIVSVLVENRSASHVGAEHGLALHIETSRCRLLFDAGASPLVVTNASSVYLGATWSGLNTVVLSHGHYDHTGGLVSVLELLDGTVPVHVGEGFFKRKARRRGDCITDIGVPWSRKALEDLGACFIESSTPRQIGPGCFVSGRIELNDSWEPLEPELCITTLSGALIPDPFEEERVLSVVTDDGLVVFSGCAHRGLSNAIAAAAAASGVSRVRAVFGGAHLRRASNDRIMLVAQDVARLDPERVVLGHCTGERAERIFSDVLGHRFESLKAGAVYNLD